MGFEVFIVVRSHGLRALGNDRLCSLTGGYEHPFGTYYLHLQLLKTGAGSSSKIS